jgi:hypothetical protein
MEGEKVAIIHTLAGERMKSWSPEKYQEIADYLITNHYRVITVGASTDSVKLVGACNLVGKTSIRRLAGILRRADLFFGLDSFPMHLANAFGIPSVVLSCLVQQILGKWCAGMILFASCNQMRNVWDAAMIQPRIDGPRMCLVAGMSSPA